MNSIKDEIRIGAPTSQVYQALSTQAGYRGFWNAITEVPESVGGEAVLRFVKDGQPINMWFRIDETKPSTLVRWTCIAHDFPSWVGTTLAWKLTEAAGETMVSFEHAGWKEGAPDAVAQGWKHFIASLKAYVETGKGQP